MNPAKIEIVVARYDEDVRWLRWLHLDRIDRVLVFNKGDEHVRTHHAFPMEKAGEGPRTRNKNRTSILNVIV